jgi:glycosyltransferase involved in cell wall biosynthesis
VKILLDPQIFIEQQYGGISRYYTEVISILSKNDEFDIQIPILATYNNHFNESILVTNTQKKILSLINILSKIKISLKSKIRRQNYKKAKNEISLLEFDLFIPTYYNPYFIDLIKDKPFVLTVYDMIFELFPEYKLANKELIENKLYLIEKATRIIAVSENTKKDIIAIYPHIDSSKIDVVYHGTSIKVNNSNDISLPNKYILFVGLRGIYKNFTFFIKAISDLLLNDQELYVICAGGGKFNSDELQLINDLGIASQVIQKDFKEYQLGSFYAKAKCFVFPSIYEGFGIPVIESMSCGCPVVLAKHSSFTEVAGNAGVYFDLNDCEDLKNKIKSLLQNTTLHNDFSLKGLKQSEKFKWDDAAIKCHEVYKKALL